VKVKPLDPVSVAAARRVLSECDVQHARDIHIEAIAARYGAMILPGKQATARGSIMRAGQHAVIRIPETAMGRSWGRFTGAHETGHHCMHPLADHFEQCHGERDDEKRGGTAWRIEREANHFATELLIPEAFGAPLCMAARPTVDDVEHLARTFNTSFEMSAIRMVQLAKAPCAVVLSVDGQIKWAPESLTFPGKIVQKRMVQPTSIAERARKPKRGDERPREVPGEAWGGDVPFLEQALRVGPGRVLSWIVPA
jgi:Zn-dependent peptidase ImmA (M78 family)